MTHMQSSAGTRATSLPRPQVCHATSLPHPKFAMPTRLPHFSEPNVSSLSRPTFATPLIIHAVGINSRDTELSLLPAGHKWRSKRHLYFTNIKPPICRLICFPSCS